VEVGKTVNKTGELTAGSTKERVNDIFLDKEVKAVIEEINLIL